MRVFRFTLVFIVCWSAVCMSCIVKDRSDGGKKMAEMQCNKFGIRSSYIYKVFPFSESQSKLKDCTSNLMKIIQNIGTTSAKYLFRMFEKYFVPNEISEDRRTELFKKLEEISNALKASGWDVNMMYAFFKNYKNIRDDTYNLRLTIILNMLSKYTRQDEVRWPIVLKLSFLKLHKFMENIESILKDHPWRRFYNVYLQWWRTKGKVIGKYIALDGVQEIYEFCLESKHCSENETILFQIFDSIQDCNLHVYYSSSRRWPLNTLQACLKNESARYAKLPVLFAALSKHENFNETLEAQTFKDVDIRFTAQDVWTELIGCDTNTNCLNLTVNTLTKTQNSKISGTAFRNLMRTEVKEKGRHKYDGYAFLLLLSHYKYVNHGKFSYSDSNDVSIAQNEKFLRTLFQIQDNITPISIKSLGINSTFQPMAALAEKTKWDCKWTSKELIDFIIMAKENHLEAKDFADFLKLTKNLGCAPKIIENGMKPVLQFINSLGLRFNRKSVWKKLEERNKNLSLSNIVEANTRLTKDSSRSTTVNAIFRNFFWNKNMLLCDRPETFEKIYQDVIGKTGSLKEYDYNKIFETRCLEEQKLIMDENAAKDKKKKEEEEKSRRQASESSDSDSDDSGRGKRKRSWISRNRIYFV